MIKDLKEGMSAKGIYIVKSATKLQTNVGKSYFSLVLEDKTGKIEAKKWNIVDNDAEILIQGRLISIAGEVVSYRDKLQIKIESVNEVDEKEVDISLYVGASKKEIKELSQKLEKYILSINNKVIKDIVDEILNKGYYLKFSNYPAAVKMHHDYLHGLIEHTISMCEVAEFMAKHYEDVNYDLLIGGALLHDIGKVVELSAPVAPEYTLEGSLIGHISIGEDIIDETAKKLGYHDKEEVLYLKHMVLSHHGHLEFGSPVLPQLKEAYLLSQIDETDAKMSSIQKALDDVKEGEFTDKIYALDSRVFYKIKK